jgi:hypothetical protein
LERPLRHERGSESIGRTREDGVGAIASGLDDHPTVGGDHLGENGIVASERCPHGLAVLLPEPRAAFDIGE